MNVSRRYGVFFIVSLFLLISILVGYRDLSIGTDTTTYKYYFDSIGRTYKIKNYEIGFEYISVLIASITSDHRKYFSILFLILNAFYFFSFRNLSYYKNNNRENEAYGYFILTGFVFLSSWYAAGTLNGLRQGLSLPFSYASIIFFYRKSFVKSALLFIISASLHKTAFMILPFYAVIFLSPRNVLFIFILSALLYASGFSEVLFDKVFQYFSVELSDNVDKLTPDSDQWVGFQLDFFLYSFFWGVIFYILRFYIKEFSLYKFDVIWKMYCLLMLPYFYFAHGAFSNRYAFVGWFFLPILNTSFIVMSRLSNQSKIIFAAVIFILGLSNYVAIILGLW